MKTVEIQNQITLIKQTARAYAESKSPDDWTDFCHSLNSLVQITFETMPPKEVIREVEVRVEVPMIQQVSVETRTEIAGPALTVEKPVEITKEIPVAREVTKIVEQVVYVPVFNHGEN